MIKLSLLLSFIVIITICNNSIGVVEADATSRAMDIIREYSGIDRYTYFTTNQKLTKYPPGLCGGTPLDNCDWPKYGEAVVLLSGVTLLIALVCLVFSVLFWMGRNCFFGGCNPTHGFLCPGPKLDPEVPGEGYSKCQVWVLRLVVIAFAIAAAPLFITAITGNSRSTNGVNTFGNTVIQKGNDTISAIQDIRNNMTNTEFDRLPQFSNNATRQDMINRLDSILANGIDVRNQGLTVQEQATKYGGYRNDVVLVGLIFGLAVAILIALSGICSMPILSFLGAMVCVIVLPFMWIVFSIHYPVNSVLSDVCLAYNETGVQGLSNFTNPIVNQIFSGCQNDTNIITVFQDLNNLTLELFESAYNQSCGSQGFGQYCGQYIPVWTGNPPNYAANNDSNALIINCPTVPCNNQTLSLYVNSSGTDFMFGCYIAGNLDKTISDPTTCVTDGGKSVTYDVVPFTDILACNSTCQNPELKNVSSIIINGYDALTAFQSIYTNQVLPLIQCSFLMPFVDRIHDIICVDEVTSLELLISPTGLFSILLIGVGVTAVLGSKRFSKKARQLTNIKEMA